MNCQNVFALFVVVVNQLQVQLFFVRFIDFDTHFFPRNANIFSHDSFIIFTLPRKRKHLPPSQFARGTYAKNC